MELRFIVTANVSAGKSTLINAIAGKKVVQSTQEVCTKNICYVSNKENEDNVIDVSEICNAVAYDTICIDTYFNCFYKSDTKICLIDTPGVNYSNDYRHCEMTRKALLNERYDKLIYVFNAERLGTDDDFKHLKWIADNVTKSNVVFVLNKTDRFNIRDDNISESINNLRKDIKKLGFTENRVYPISAYYGFLVKQKCFNIQLNQRDNFEYYCLSDNKFGYKEYDLSKYYYETEDFSDKYLLQAKRCGLYGLEKILFSEKTINIDDRKTDQTLLRKESNTYKSEVKSVKEIKIRYNPYIEVATATGSDETDPNDKIMTLVLKTDFNEWAKKLPEMLVEGYGNKCLDIEFQIIEPYCVEFRSKSPNIDILFKIFDSAYRQGNPDYNLVYDLAKKMLQSEIYDCDYGSERHTRLYQILGFFANPTGERHNAEVEERGIAAIQAIAPKAYAPGKKLSRIFKAICVELGISDETAGSEFQRLYAQFADELSSKQINFKLYVSINPAHFLSMSNPKNDRRGPCLTSCHSLNSTDYEYNIGCTGYARDEVSFIVFTVADPEDPETLNNRKTTRQIYAYKPGNGLLLQSRMYNTAGGVQGAASETKLYRDLIQREISMLEGAPNLWKTYPYIGGKEKAIETGNGFGGYCDWTYSNFDAHVSIRADHKNDWQPLTVGTWGLCISCGTENNYSLYCDECKPEDTKHHCDYCDEYVSGDLTTAYDEYGNEIYVCSYCIDEHFTYCDQCEEYQEDSVIEYIDGLDICRSCRDEYYEKCENCGRYHRSEDMCSAYDKYGNKIYVCKNCYNRFYVTCSDCGKAFHENDIRDVYKMTGMYETVCESCAEDYEFCKEN